MSVEYTYVRKLKNFGLFNNHANFITFYLKVRTFRKTFHVYASHTPLKRAPKTAVSHTAGLAWEIDLLAFFF